ncbi:MAG TPA: hypothetical protein VMN39_11150 [Longimicrobiaceae bacterium]|nr:hypothetical protein [Longimicrobiaceae bacterium]
MLEVDPDQVEIFTRRAAPGSQLGLGAVGLIRAVLGRLVVLLRQATAAEGLRLLFFQEPVGREHDRLRPFGVIRGHQAEILRAVAPVEHMHVPLGLVPVDERLVCDVLGCTLAWHLVLVYPIDARGGP